jgi:hypothetical protein
MQDALQRNQLSEAGSLLATSMDLRLGPVENGWLTILNADLAWAEHDRQLALDRLRTLYSSQQIAELDDEIASRLEKWLGFGTGRDDDLQLQLNAAPFPGYFSDLLWWAAQRKVPVMEAFAARMLAKEAIGQKNFDRAITLLKRSLNISRELGDHTSSGTVSEMLAELTLRNGPFSEAAEYAASAVEHYASASKPAEETRMKTVLAIALFYSPRQSECEALIEDALARQRELQDMAGQARSLRVLGHLVFLLSGSGGAKRAEECLHEASSLYQRAGDVLGRAHSLLLIADIAYSLSQFSGLGEFCVSASQLFQITEDRIGEAHLHFILGTLAALRKYYASPAMLPELFKLRAHPDSLRMAIAHLRRARDFYLRGDDALSWAHTLTLLGAFQYVSWKHDDPGGDSDVQNMLRNALTVYEAQKDLLGIAGIDLILGQIAHGELDLERAGRHFTNAVRGFEALPLPEAAFLKSATEELLTRVEQGLGPPDKHVQHIITVWRCRSLRMQGWSVADRAETIDMITIFDLPPNEVATDAVERVRRSALPWPT